MKSKRPLRMVLGIVLAVATVSLLGVEAVSASGGNRLEASFQETAQSVTNRIADLGTLQLINTGTGSVAGFGDATVVVGITQDHALTPCGAGSWMNASTRRITLSQGVLVLVESGAACQTPSGPSVIGTYTIDGASSTGLFAGAWGSGSVRVDVASHTSSLSGRIHLPTSAS